MAKQGIDTGGLSGIGADTLYEGALKINSNFDEIYNTFGDGTTLNPSLGGGVVGSAGTWAVNAVGIHTTKNVGIGTELSTSALTVEGDGRFSGVITATSVVKSGGTSSEFLKADGSVDTNTYLTSYTETDTLSSVTLRGDSTSTGLNVSGVITSSSFVKSGGTSSEFLKADGSVDTNTYLTTESQTLDSILALGNTSSIGMSIGVVTATRFESLSAGTPTLDSPNNLNINAITVAISTDLTVGRDLDVTGNATLTNLNALGIITSSNFVGNLTGNSDTSTYATSAGISTLSQNLTGNPSVTVTDLTALGNVSIAGTLTYEDVTNVDSIGIITARSDVHVGSGLSVVGVSTLGNTVVGGATTELIVNGDVRIIGILTIGTSSITLDGTNNQISSDQLVGNLTGNVNSSGVSTISQLNVGIGGTIITTTDIGSVGVGTTNPLTRLDLNGGTLSFGKKGPAPNSGDISIGNTSTSLGYDGISEFLYPHYQNNIFIGNDVFKNRSNTSLPSYNVVIGDRAGNTLGDGCVENVIIGRLAGYVNQGNGNNFIGMSAGESNIGGYFNNFIGYYVGINNTEGYYNDFIGNEAGYRNTTGNNNFYGGQYTGYFNQTGSYNLAVGPWAANGFSGSVTNKSYNIHLGSVNGGTIGGSYQVLIGSGNASGNRYFDLPDPNKDYQFAVGVRTDANPSKYWLVGNEQFNVGIGTTNPKTKFELNGVLGFSTYNWFGETTCQIKIGDSQTGKLLSPFSQTGNILIGVGAGSSLSNEDDNVFIGQDAGYFSNGSGNIFVGRNSGYFNTSGFNNTFVGKSAGQNNETGYLNSSLGINAGHSNISGDYNVSLGAGSGYFNETGNSNIYLGGNNGISVNASAKIIIGSGDVFGNYFDSPDVTKDTQFAIGVRTDSNPSKYWLVGNENFDVGIGTTNPTSKLHVGGDMKVSGVSTLSSNVSVGGTISIDGGVTLTTNNATIVGTSGSAGEIKQIGGAPFYYDGSAWREFVLSSGTPVTVPADTEWDNVVFRATFDDDFTDAKFGATPVFVSAASTIVGAAVTIGTGAYRNTGGNVGGIGVSYAYRSDYDFTGSWTIEFWIYHDSTPLAYESLVSQVSTTDGSGDWTFGVYNNGTSLIYYWDNENNPAGVLFLHAYSLSGSWQTIFLDKWVHYALVREGDNGSIHLYFNGVESPSTINDAVIDNDILHINGAGLGFGAAFGNQIPDINSKTWNNFYSIDAIFDDVRISCGVGTAGQRYTSIGISTEPTFTPPTTQLPITGTLSSVVNPPGDKYGEITLGGSPTWRGTSGVTVSQQSSGNYRVSFASSYTNANDYYVLSQGMDQGFASYVGIARSTTHVDLAINRQSNDAAVDTGALAVQIKNHI